MPHCSSHISIDCFGSDHPSKYNPEENVNGATKGVETNAEAQNGEDIPYELTLVQRTASAPQEDCDGAVDGVQDEDEKPHEEGEENDGRVNGVDAEVVDHAASAHLDGACAEGCANMASAFLHTFDEVLG
jgi:hypothetical protein